MGNATTDLMVGALTELQLNSILFLIFVFFGVLLCCYALYVEYRHQTQHRTDNQYVASCDISNRVSCSRVLTSKYARGLGILREKSKLYMSNAMYGLFFYGFLVILEILSFFFEHSPFIAVLLLLSLLAVNLTDVYLAYILIKKLKDFCIVCVSWYIVNLVLFGLAIWRCSVVF